MKDLSVESLRGLACLLLVGYHVVGGTGDQGLRVADDSFLRYINDTLLYLRMPLFTFLSGYVYAMRPVERDGLGFLGKKVRRLLVPMLVVGTVYVLVQMVVPGANQTSSLKDLYSFYPVAHFWFLEALMLVFLVIAPLEISGVLKNRSSFLLVFLAFSTVYLLNVQPTIFFSINGAIYLMPYFLLGIAVYRFRFDDLAASAKYAIGFVALGGMALSQLGLNGVLDLELGRQGWVAYLAGTTGVVLLFLVRFQNGLLARIGKYSYTIFLFHVFATAAARIALERLGVQDHGILLVSGIAMGIALPMVLETMLDRYNLPRLLLFGRNFHAKPATKLSAGHA